MLTALDSSKESEKNAKKTAKESEKEKERAQAETLRVRENLELRVQLAVSETKSKCSVAMLGIYERATDRAHSSSVIGSSSNDTPDSAASHHGGLAGILNWD